MSIERGIDDVAIMEAGHEDMVVRGTSTPAGRRLVCEDDVAPTVEDHDVVRRGFDDRLQQCDLAVAGLRRARQRGDVAPEQDQAVIVGQDGKADGSSRAEGGRGLELDRPVALNRLVDRGAIARAGDQIPEVLPQAVRPGPAQRLQDDVVDVDNPAVAIDQKIFIARGIEDRAQPEAGAGQLVADLLELLAIGRGRGEGVVVQRGGRIGRRKRQPQPLARDLATHPKRTTLHIVLHGYSPSSATARAVILGLGAPRTSNQGT